MAILAFQKPDKVLMLEADNFFGKFEFRPLEPGYGITIGNALRRILLSSLEGFAITSIKIDGVDHEFGTIPGVIEDVTNIILNLKQVRFKHIVDDIENEKVSITVSGSEVFKAGDIGKQLTGFEILNPDLYIEGVLFTMYDARTNLSLQVVENVKDNLKQTIYKTIIPRNVRLAEAPSYGLPINLYDKRSSGAEAYRMLADEVIENAK